MEETETEVTKDAMTICGRFSHLLAWFVLREMTRSVLKDVEGETRAQPMIVGEPTVKNDRQALIFKASSKI